MSDDFFRDLESADLDPIIEELLTESGARSIKKKGDEFIANCPHPSHDDKNPSFNINSQGLFKCHSCGYKGNILQLTSDVKGLSKEDSIKWLSQQTGIPLKEKVKKKKPKRTGMAGKTVSSMEVDSFKRAMQDERQAGLRARIVKDWCLPDESIIAELELGYSVKEERVCIPIRDAGGRYRNIRMYSFVDRQNKIKSYLPGLGDNYLYPVEGFKDQDNVIWLFEGEKDCICARAHGLNSMTVTAGSKSWDSSWNDKFKDKTVYICYDIDEAGMDGALRIANQLCHKSAEVKIIVLPIAGMIGSNGNELNDFVDFMSDGGGSIQSLITLAEGTIPFTSEDAHKININHVDFTDIIGLGDANNQMKTFNLSVRTTGLDPIPYVIPRKVKVVCNEMKPMEACKKCDLGTAGSNKKVTLDKSDPRIVNFIDVSSIQRDVYILNNLVRCNAKCSKTIEVMHSWNATSVDIAEQIESGSGTEDSRKSVNHDIPAYHIYDTHPMESNSSYNIFGYLSASPKDGKNLPIITEAKPEESDLELFQVTDEFNDRMKVFEVDIEDEESSEALDIIKQKSMERIRDLAWNVTDCRKRYDTHFAMDLCFHSALNFNVDKHTSMDRGWVDCLIFGDSRSGKSMVALKLADHYRHAAVMSGECCSEMGIKGGIKVIPGKRNSVSWGRAPAQDKRMLIIDEAHDMKVEVIGSLTNMRGDGRADINKGGINQSARARTRLSFIANPKYGGEMSEFQYPIKEIMKIFVNEEDVTRFDFVLCISNDDSMRRRDTLVWDDTGEIESDHVFTSDLCNELITFMWSRKSDNIHFTDAALKRLKVAGKSLSDIYVSTGLPLIQKTYITPKLARLAVSLAGMLHSVDESGENVIVTAAHVGYVARWLHRIYSSGESGYLAYSEMVKEESVIRNEETLVELMGVLRQSGDYNSFLLQILSPTCGAMSKETIGALVGSAKGLGRKTIDTLLSELISCNAFKHYHSRYKPTQAFTAWIKEYNSAFTKAKKPMKLF